MALNVSGAFFSANTILNSNLGKYDIVHIIGVTEDSKALTYLAKDITKGFYYRDPSIEKGDAEENFRIVPENSTIEDFIKKAVMFELVNLDGTFTRYKIISKKPPDRPSFQWSFKLGPNTQDKREII